MCLIILLYIAVHQTIVSGDENMMVGDELTRAISKWKYVEVSFVLESLSIYQGKKPNTIIIGLKVASSLAEVLIRKVGCV